MELGVSVSTTYDRLRDAAAWAETVGLAALAVPDHVLRSHATDPALAETAPAPDPFVQLAALARETHRVDLVVLSSPITFRHPAILLKAATELSIVSEGRFVLGVGTGYRQSEHDVFGIPFPSSADRWAMLEEALHYLRAGMTRPNPGFEGARFRLAAHPIAPPPNRLCLLVGGKGDKRTPVLAGKFADEYNLFLDEPARLASRIEVAASARGDGEVETPLRLSVAGVLVTAPDRISLDQVVATRAAEVGMGADEFARLHAGPGSLLGTYDEVAERLRELTPLGIERCYFVFERAVDRLGVEAIRDRLT